MQRFFEMARSELYPDTPGDLCLRISPSAAFRSEGKLLAPLTENRKGYMEPDGEGGTLEEWWEEEILDKWLTPEEDVWAVKAFVSSPSLRFLPSMKLTELLLRTLSTSSMELTLTRRLEFGN